MWIILLLSGLLILLFALFYAISRYLEGPNLENRHNRFSSKIKDIYIELHNYTFFHSPEGVKKAYSRYVGRHKLKERLKAILTNSETKSGAYLITGFRGMGKTSLVRKSIAEIKGNYYYARFRHFRQFLFVVLVYLFYSKIELFQREWNQHILYLALVLCFFAIWYLVWHDKNRPNIWRYYNEKYILHIAGWLWEVIKSIVRIFDPEMDYYKRSRFKTILQDLIIVTLLFLISKYLLRSINEAPSIFWIIGVIAIVNLGYFTIVFVNNNIQLELQQSDEPNRLKSFFTAFVRIFGNAIKRSDFGNKVPIEISLSQDDLKEVDILKLLSKNIYSEYRGLRNRLLAPNQIIFSAIQIAAVFLVVSIVYFYEPVYQQINEFRYRSKVVQWFPSQAVFPHMIKIEGNNNESTYKFHEKFLLQDELLDKGYTVNRYIKIINERNATLRNDRQHPIFKKYVENQDHYKNALAISNFVGLLERDLKQIKNDTLALVIAKDKLLYTLKNSLDSALLREVITQLENPIKEFSYSAFLDATQVYELRGFVSPVNDNSLRGLVVSLDIVIQTLYQKLFNKPVHEAVKMNQKIGNLAGDFQFPPIILDYFYLIAILLVYLSIKLVGRYSWRIGLMTHTYILRRLKELNENIAAQVTQDHQKGLSTGVLRQTINFFNRRTKTYPIAGVREIENELIDILREIDKIPTYSSRPEFIFIFDELDKIEANYNINILEKEGEQLSSFGNEEEGYFSTESIRKRQETIARILGNLKLFFNTARAKFIFIAGREMYDASLADISDRDAFISSIFHEIIYVESFFKDPGNQYHNGITGLTEEFVCQLLMPRFSRYERNLKGYNLYLKDHFTRQESMVVGFLKWINRKSPIRQFRISYQESFEQAEERRKVIYSLQQFITFLTYRGNGSPKKITKLLESFVYRSSEKRILNPRNISYARNSKNLYLVFDELCQYRLGLTHHLFKPYLIAHLRFMRNYADKTLVATAFLLDHLYKFHNTGFSWENLELTPEIIAINRSPKLRKFIAQLIDFMSNDHIDEIVNGLYQFKFNVRIASEISFVSTISESEAAAFNFTLDESLLLKRHYRKKLKDLDIRYKSHFSSESPRKHIQAISYINSIIGDLHFYDREYDEAVLHFQEASQFLLENKSELPDIEDFVFLIRLLLKTGLTYEKMRDYDAAHITVGRVSKMIRDYSGFFESFYSWTEKRRMKKQVFENLQLIFQPILAQFMLIEKGGPNGITADDLINAKKEFELIQMGLEGEEKFIISSEFENKLGDILYFKNGMLLYSGGSAKYTKELLGNIELPEVFRRNRKRGDFKGPFSAYRQYLACASLTALKINSLYGLFDLGIGKPGVLELPKVLEIFVEFLGRNFNRSSDVELNLSGNGQQDPSLQYSLLKTIGSNLSDLSNTLICFLDEEDAVDWSVLKKMFFENEQNLEFKNNTLLNSMSSKPKTCTGLIFQVHLLAGYCYLRAGDYYRYAAHLKNLLILIKRLMEYKSEKNSHSVDPFNFKIITLIADETLKMIDRHGSYTRRQKLYEWEAYFDVENVPTTSAEKENDEKRLLFSDSVLKKPDSKEVYILIKELQLKFYPRSVYKAIGELRVSTPYVVVNNQYNRILELYYKSNLHYKLLKKHLPSTFPNSTGNMLSGLLNKLKADAELLRVGIGESAEDVLIYLISDSIYCLHEILRIYGIFGISHIFNHSLRATAHEHFGNWCHLFHLLKEEKYDSLRHEKFVLRLENAMSELIGRVDFQSLDIGYHYTKSIEHFYSSLEMHHGGTAYRHAIEGMYYLDDDFDDNLTHFYVAMERYRVNTGFVRGRIKRNKERLKDVDDYSFENLFD